MRGETARRIESAVETAAKLSFAAAVGFALFSFLESMAGEPGLGAFTAGAAVIAYLLCDRIMKRVAPAEPRFTVPIFDVAALANVDELQPTGTPAAADEPLVLDDILAEIGPDSRVVRLFDPAAMPTPGQLRARIDRHLDGQEQAAPDASQALYDALADLRRSLR